MATGVYRSCCKTARGQAIVGDLAAYCLEPYCLCCCGFLSCSLQKTVVRYIGELRERNHSRPERHVVGFSVLRVAGCGDHGGCAGNGRGHCVLISHYPSHYIGLVLYKLEHANVSCLYGDRGGFFWRSIICLLLRLLNRAGYRFISWRSVGYGRAVEQVSPASHSRYG